MCFQGQTTLTVAATQLECGLQQAALYEPIVRYVLGLGLALLASFAASYFVRKVDWS